MALEASDSTSMKRLDELIIQLDVAEENVEGPALSSLAGKILTEKSLNKGAVKNILCKAWDEPQEMEISDFGKNLFLFTFKSKVEADEVLKKGPWYVMNKLVSLQSWAPQAIMGEIVFSRVQFWIQLHGLPIENLNVKSAGTIFFQLGEVVEIEDPRYDGHLLRHFIRARVKINIQHPLSTGCWIPRQNLPNTWVQFKYEKLQDMCFKCGVIGHEQRSCKKEKERSVIDNTVQRYGSLLSVPPAKDFELIREERNRWKERVATKAQDNNDPNRGAARAEDSGFSQALTIQTQEEQGNRVESPASEGARAEGDLPREWVSVTPEGSPSPSWRLLRETCSVSPFVSLPFSNLRMQAESPGFQYEIGEKRFGEFPLRPNSIGAEGSCHREEEGRGNKPTEQQVAGSDTLTKDIARREKERKDREERKEESLGWQEKIDFDNFLRAEKMGTVLGVLQGRHLVEPGNKGSNLTSTQAQGGFDDMIAGRSADTNRNIQSFSATKKDEKGKGRVEVFDWEKERENNIEHYAQIKEDLVALQQEVTEYYEGEKEDSLYRGDPSHTGHPPPPTQVELFSNIRRPGLGPELVEQLGLEEEDIGLKKSVVLLDYPSPLDRYLSLQLTEQEIKRCREHCGSFFDRVKRKSKVLKGKNDGNENNEDTQLEGQKYVVEFPPEDLDRDTGGQNKLGDAEEISLVNKISEALVLKRPRNLICENEFERDEGEADERSKKFKSCVPEEDMQGVVWGREMFQYDGGGYGYRRKHCCAQ